MPVFMPGGQALLDRGRLFSNKRALLPNKAGLMEDLCITCGRFLYYMDGFQILATKPRNTFSIAS